MTLYTFGPLAYAECLKMVTSISKSVKKIFIFYTAQEQNSRGNIYNNCKDALSTIQDYFDGVSFPCNCAFIKVWYDERDHIEFPNLTVDVENPSRLPVFKMWSSNRKIEGVECLNAVKLNTYLINEGFQCKPKQEPLAMKRDNRNKRFESVYKCKL
ncbi:uncharacterized protein LOC106663514 isoform X2 [Cimex lectularius]|uniref:Uncharacterized protein n=1 Tax=Cimex lectularius TaxID=79782 RepID=A0A8I6SPN2_CIMLE|nr:uncharacterized protein LOC106663514 isoform X2 [Cimex lectularius]